MSCTNQNPILRSYIKLGAWNTRHKTGTNSNCNGIHPSTRTYEYDSNFWNTCGSWLTTLNFYAVADGNHGGVTAEGCIGVTVCPNAFPFHPAGRAFDLTKIYFSSGNHVDMEKHHKGTSSTSKQRRYLAIVAMTRRYFSSTLTAYLPNGAAHETHIHFDNWNAVGSINKGKASDTSLVQTTCNLINGASLLVDGNWGSSTNAAYLNLLNNLGMSCYSPTTNSYHSLLFLTIVARHGFANRSAGWFQYGC